ncbi:hypothetical protein CC85DRAFT_331401 [Cutaneotrichosporon oleaginosum]|uniref:Uncharacterized protein n=1 Tax=Cutaneotrichosporon oleaginosum TaxID=879819 RepID=A0A0J0XC70_9TREE|nr:uncharacterized protein CC85DRAFT_331401 [Cutaneotrichosporon oleaginosum]KLT38666.1 hypothetical protein CC85DRAFT_331401 [Cutaneotrichosporon oleaginosum]TXT12287.1 hypothetical protein COLE_02697 [Cutaneotrichosporon oleaginosum]
MPKKPKCPVCGSRKWRKTRDGQVVCEDGHVLQGVRTETNEMTGPTAHALQKRRMLKGGERINKRKVYGRADRGVYHGAQAEALRLQGLQVLLRHQVAAVRRLWGVPEALEAIARDLWAYQVILSGREGGRGRKSRRRSLGDDVTTPTQTDGEGEGEGDSGSESGSDGSDGGSGSGKSDSDKEEESEFELDADLVALDDDDDGDGDGDADPGPDDGIEGSEDETKPPWKRLRALRISDVLVTLALSLYILRVPFTFQRLEALVNTAQIPYIDFARTTLLPPPMVRHMNRGVRRSLRPQRAPAAMHLWENTHVFARVLHVYFAVPLPEANIPPVAWFVVSQLGGTARTYDQVVRLLAIVVPNLGITARAYAPREVVRRTGAYAAAMPRAWDAVMPELTVAAAWVVVMKMAYGLDGRTRLRLRADAALGMPKMEEWVGELERRLCAGAFTGSLRDLEPLQFHEMGGVAIDAFLDRAEHVLLADRVGGAGAAFPLPRVARTAYDPNSWAAFHARSEEARPARHARMRTRSRTKSGRAQGCASAHDMTTPDLPLLPGDAVRIYTLDKGVPHELGIVLASAAAVVGVDVDAVRRLVNRFERRMERARPKGPAGRRSLGALRETRSFGSLGEVR